MADGNAFETIASPSDGEALSLDVELLSFDVDIN